MIDETSDPKARAAMKLLLSRNTMARPFAAPPSIPAERAAALRRAFDTTMKDKNFLDEARRNRLEVRPVTGEALAWLVDEAYASPPDVVALAQQVVKE